MNGIREHIVTAAQELRLPLTQRDVDRLTTRVLALYSYGQAPRVHLTQQQLEILAGLADGETNEATARRLCLSPDTIKSHKRRLYKRLGVGSAAKAVAVAYREGILRAPGRSG